MTTTSTQTNHAKHACMPLSYTNINQTHGMHHIQKTLQTLSQATSLKANNSKPQQKRHKNKPRIPCSLHCTRPVHLPVLLRLTLSSLLPISPISLLSPLFFFSFFFFFFSFFFLSLYYFILSFLVVSKLFKGGLLETVKKGSSQDPQA